LRYECFLLSPIKYINAGTQYNKSTLSKNPEQWSSDPIEEHPLTVGFKAVSYGVSRI
jgi:hypothetical protein